MEEKTKYCGIDVSNETLDLYFLNQEGIHQHLQISNTVTVLAEVIYFIRLFNPLFKLLIFNSFFINCSISSMR